VISEKLFFTTLKEDRGWYFVEYKPPIPSCQFATLSLVVPGVADTAQVADSMERELRAWIQRYPIPLMVSAFDAKDDLYNLDGFRLCNHLIGYLDNTSDEVRLFWRLLKNDEIPNDALDVGYLQEVYSDISYKTADDLQLEGEKHAKQLRVGWLIVFVWAAVVPALVVIVEWASPHWVATLVLIYSLWKALVKTLKMLGKWKKSPREIEEEREEQRMRHHHYHCERNPEAFLRLKVENFECWEKERIQAEANFLKSKKLNET